MRYTADQKQEARDRLLAAAGRAFRREGYGGIGVDGLAKEAGVTSGAFYGHFKSKDAAFAEVAIVGLAQLSEAVADLQSTYPDDWAERFINFYLTDRLTCDLDQSCALQSLTADVMRSDEATKTRYEAKFEEVVARISSGLRFVDPNQRVARARAVLGLLSGGITIARSLSSLAQRSALAADLHSAARLLIGLS